MTPEKNRVRVRAWRRGPDRRRPCPCVGVNARAAYDDTGGEGRGGPAPKLRRRNEREGEAARPGSRSAATSRPGHLAAVALRHDSRARVAGRAPAPVIPASWVARVRTCSPIAPEERVHCCRSTCRSPFPDQKFRTPTPAGVGPAPLDQRVDARGVGCLSLGPNADTHIQQKGFPLVPGESLPSRVMICCVSRQWWSLEL